MICSSKMEINREVSIQPLESIKQINIVNLEKKSSFKNSYIQERLLQQQDDQNQKVQEINNNKIEAISSLLSSNNQQNQKQQGHLIKKHDRQALGCQLHPFNVCCDISEMYLDFLSLELCVGQIQEAWNHLFSEKLMCFTINVGSETREIASGLRKFLPQEEFDGQCIVFKNLKPKNLLGFQSNGMMLTVANSDYTKVEILRPPYGSKIGQRIMIEGMEQYFKDKTNFYRLTLKGKTWLKTKTHLKIDENLKANFNGKQLITCQGAIYTQSLSNCSIS